MVTFKPLYIGLLLLVVACGQAPKNSAQIETTPTARIVAPTSTTAPVLSPTAKDTKASSTPKPTSTTRKRNFTRTPVQPTPTPTITPPGLALLNAVYTRSSPDGLWLWENEPGNIVSGKELEITHIVSFDGRTEWRVQPSVAEIGDWPKAYYEPIFWSPTEPYVFLAGSVCCGDGPGSAYIKTSLVRLNLTTGAVSTQVPWGSYHSFSFAPNGKYMNRSTIGEHSIHITRLFDAFEIEVVLPERYQDFAAGHWSPGGRWFVLYVCESDNPSEEFCQKMPILLVDAETGAYQIIFEDFYGKPWDTAWIDATHFQFTNLEDSSEIMIFDIETGKFVP